MLQKFWVSIIIMALIIIHERRLQWYSHVMRGDENYMGKRVMVLEVEGTRGSKKESKGSHVYFHM